MSNPVHFNAESTVNWQGDPEPIGWYFWIETWADRCGPYDTEAHATTEANRYVREVLGE